MLLLFDGMWWYPQRKASGEHRLSFVWDFNALSQLAKTYNKEGFNFIVGIQDHRFINMLSSESTLKSLHDFLEGELDESSHEIFEVFNNQSIPFIGSVDYGKREAESSKRVLPILQQDQMMRISWPWPNAAGTICGQAKQQRWRNMTKNRARKKQQRLRNRQDMRHCTHIIVVPKETILGT